MLSRVSPFGIYCSVNSLDIIAILKFADMLALHLKGGKIDIVVILHANRV